MVPHISISGSGEAGHISHHRTCPASGCPCQLRMSSTIRCFCSQPISRDDKNLFIVSPIVKLAELAPSLEASGAGAAAALRDRYPPFAIRHDSPSQTLHVRSRYRLKRQPGPVSALDKSSSLRLHSDRPPETSASAATTAPTNHFEASDHRLTHLA